MRRYLLRLSYIGTSYRGAQKHSNKNIVDIDSIQGSVETGLHKIKHMITGYPSVVLAGRTDAGVHALYTAAHFDLEFKSGETNFDTTNLIRLMNRYFISSGHEIRILSCQEVSKKFHARFSAKSRTYVYRFLMAKEAIDHRIPIAESGRTLHLQVPPSQFSMERLMKGIELFKEKRDYTTFSSRITRKNTPDISNNYYVRKVHVNIEEGIPFMPFDPHSKNFTYWNITFKSRSFLYNQVRRMVGALFALGLNKINEDEMLTMLQVPSHNNWNPKAVPANPHGLYLLNVEYDDADLQLISA